MPIVAEGKRVGDVVAEGVICVLGMHRSGTSLAASVIYVLGASLGPEEELVPAAPDNSKGFSEHKPIVDLNNDLLERLGGRSFAPPALPAGWESRPELDDLRMRGQRVASELLSGADLLVWKDPRTCLTLAFWQRLMPPMRYVICVRHPSDVARSLRHRNHVAYEKSSSLWLLYNRGALTGTTSQPRCVVIYDRLIDNPQEEVAKLASFIGTPGREHQPGVALAIESLVDPGLRHHQSATSSGPPAGERSISFRMASRAYDLLAQDKSFDEAAVDALLEQGLDAVRLRDSTRASEKHEQAAVTNVDIE